MPYQAPVKLANHPVRMLAVAMRTEDVEEYRPIRSLLRRLIHAPTVFAILWPTLLVVGGYVGWQRWGNEHVTAQFQGMEPSNIQINAPPSIVRSDIVQAVYRDTAMENLSLLDRQATAKIASAFALHPWVRNVIGVRKLPGGAIDVRLEYRTPVAMVHVFKPDPNDRGSYFFPIDGDGVLLPTADFARSETRDFIHIEIPNTYSTNAFVGSPFGDLRVKYAAQLAAVLMPYRQQAGIRSITILGDSRHREVPQFEVLTTDGTRFPWGSPPGTELPGEATANLKLRNLIDTLPETGSGTAGIRNPAASNVRMASPLSTSRTIDQR